MGLDIYGHLVKKVRNSKEEPLKSVEEYCKLANKRAKQRFANYAKKSIKALSSANEEQYPSVYMDVMGKMKNYTCYEFTYDFMLKKPKSIEEVVTFFKDFKSTYYAEPDVYFRKVNFVYRYFSNKLVDECCFVEKSDMEDLISRCDKVIKNHSLASELLPTQSGFFFGSIEYDNWYFNDVKDCKEQIEKILKKFNEKTDVFFFIMSW